MEKKIDFEGDFSTDYEAIAQKIIPAYHAIYELTQHLLRESLGQIAKVLVAGTGKEIIDYSRNYPNWRLTGFDPSEKMLTISKRKINATSLQNQISLVHGLIDDVDEKGFDAATSILVMHFLQDDGSKSNFLKSIAEKIKTGGLFVLVDLEGLPGSEEYDTFNAAWKNQQIFTRSDSERVLEEFLMREDEVYFISQNRIESLLNEAGFVKINKFFKAYLFGGYIAIKK